MAVSRALSCVDHLPAGVHHVDDDYTDGHSPVGTDDCGDDVCRDFAASFTRWANNRSYAIRACPHLPSGRYACCANLTRIGLVSISASWVARCDKILYQNRTCAARDDRCADDFSTSVLRLPATKHILRQSISIDRVQSAIGQPVPARFRGEQYRCLRLCGYRAARHYRLVGRRRRSHSIEPVFESHAYESHEWQRSDLFCGPWPSSRSCAYRRGSLRDVSLFSG